MTPEKKLELIMKIESILAKIIPFYLAYLIVKPNSILNFILYIALVFIIYIIAEIYMQTVNEIS